MIRAASTPGVFYQSACLCLCLCPSVCPQRNGGHQPTLGKPGDDRSHVFHGDGWNGRPIDHCAYASAALLFLGPPALCRAVSSFEGITLTAPPHAATARSRPRSSPAPSSPKPRSRAPCSLLTRQLGVPWPLDSWPSHTRGAPCVRSHRPMPAPPHTATHALKWFPRTCTSDLPPPPQVPPFKAPFLPNHTDPGDPSGAEVVHGNRSALARAEPEPHCRRRWENRQL